MKNKCPDVKGISNGCKVFIAGFFLANLCIPLFRKDSKPPCHPEPPIPKCKYLGMYMESPPACPLLPINENPEIIDPNTRLHYDYRTICEERTIKIEK